MFLLIGLGVYGVLAGAASMAESNKSTAYSVVKDTSQSFTFYIEKVSFLPREWHVTLRLVFLLEVLLFQFVWEDSNLTMPWLYKYK